MLPLALLLISHPVQVVRNGAQLSLNNGDLVVTLDRATGRVSLSHGGKLVIRDGFGEARVGERTLRTVDLVRHEVETRSVHDRLGEGVVATFRHRGAGSVELRQTVWLYRGLSEAFVRLSAAGREPLATNYLAPIVSEQRVALAHRGPLRSLFVPYDNDSYVRYSSEGWSGTADFADGSHEVGALYDDESLGALVVGSIDHELWKSAVGFGKSGGVRAFAGVANRFTHDNEPHGSVTGREVRSPRFLVGFYDDWRTGLERFGDINAAVQPPLKWNGDVPFGWNSWSGHKNKVSAKDANAALEFVRDDLPTLRSGGVAYINLDSYWDNLTREELVAFAQKAHASGLKAGIYWTPFVNWGEPDWKTVKGYHFRDLQLKDSAGNLLPKLDGGWPLDPTHPGTLARIDETLDDLVAQGFDYIKFDFMTHGALEGRHYDPKVATGTAAYRFGMRHILDRLSAKRTRRPIFVSLSIAPMFPHGYAHSRRISCDVFSNIGASEYFLNSQNYGWWTAGRLYRFNDPDSTCVYQARGEDPTTEAEARTRFTASVIGGGMMLEGDDLTNPAARDRVQKIFANSEALDLARRTPSFRPVRGDTGDKAGEVFVFHDRDGEAFVAAFNFDKANAHDRTLRLSDLGLRRGTWRARDLWSTTQSRVTDTLDLHLPPMDCALVRLTPSPN